MAAEGRPHRSAWPYGLALALAAMISVSLTLLGIAIAYPDAQVEAHPLAVDGTPPRSAD
jgi:hypothetical protein